MPRLAELFFQSSTFTETSQITRTEFKKEQANTIPKPVWKGGHVYSCFLHIGIFLLQCYLSTKCVSILLITFALQSDL